MKLSNTWVFEKQSHSIRALFLAPTPTFPSVRNQTQDLTDTGQCFATLLALGSWVRISSKANLCS